MLQEVSGDGPVLYTRLRAVGDGQGRQERKLVSSHCSSLQVSLQEKTQVHEAQLCWDSMDMSLTDLSAHRDTGDCSWGTTHVPHPHHGILTCTCSCGKAGAGRLRHSRRMRGRTGSWG